MADVYRVGRGVVGVSISSILSFGDIVSLNTRLRAAIVGEERGGYAMAQCQGVAAHATAWELIRITAEEMVFEYLDPRGPAEGIGALDNVENSRVMDRKGI